ncbi:FMN-dependent NADH-azoreductase [Pseudomonas frederiksbergensis]|uniref:FMN-dependent NADH-azoreductase n=1 Tax=Pseudomonas frederiksbergensis TaxID=104087 RepID=UPI003D230267
MNILHVSCSPRGQASESYRLSQSVMGHLLKSHPTAVITNRVLGAGGIAHVDENYAISQQSLEDIAQDGSFIQSEALINELESADVLVISTPMHNFTVPSALKVWIDHAARVRRTFNVGAQGKTPMLRDRPVFVAIASGGRFSGERARQPDFLTPYLKAVLNMIGLHDLNFFTVEGTALGPDAIAEARSRTDQALLAHFQHHEAQ